MILFGHNFCITFIIYFMFLLNLTNRFLARDVCYNSPLFAQFIHYNIFSVKKYVSNRCGVTAAWSRKIWGNLAKFCAFFGKATFTGTFSKFCSERIHRDTDRRAMFKFRDIGPTGNR